MSENFCYKINLVKYKHTSKSQYIFVNGWCFSKNKSNLDYSLKINDKEYEFDFLPILRMDVFKKWIV